MLFPMAEIASIKISKRAIWNRFQSKFEHDFKYSIPITVTDSVLTEYFFEALDTLKLVEARAIASIFSTNRVGSTVECLLRANPGMSAESLKNSIRNVLLRYLLNYVILSAEEDYAKRESLKDSLTKNQLGLSPESLKCLPEIEG
jgi:hypothetical protein